MTDVLDCVRRTVTENQNGDLLRPLGEDEIKGALDSMHLTECTRTNRLDQMVRIQLSIRTFGVLWDLMLCTSVKLSLLLV